MEAAYYTWWIMIYATPDIETGEAATLRIL